MAAGPLAATRVCTLTALAGCRCTAAVTLTGAAGLDCGMNSSLWSWPASARACLLAAADACRGLSAT